MLLVDSSKIGKTSFVKVGELREGDVLITDGDVDKDLVKIYKEMGVDVKIAE